MEHDSSVNTKSGQPEMEGLLQGSRKIAEGHNSLIYFNDNDTFERPVIVKTLKDEFNYYPHFTQIINEDEHIRHIDVPGVRSSLDLISIGDKHMLVLEYFEGNTLKEWITNGNHSIISRLKIAIKICKALHGVHEHHILHRDLNSYNILINTLGEISIIDFGLSTSLRVKPDIKAFTKYLEGTLPYISPEQTGRMNHVVDHRSDLYSFGVVLYEMFSGRLPFVSSDPMELVHAHLAKSPTSPADVNPEVPEIISQIILKLLAKNIEDRYQSSLGLLTDLDRCLKQLASKFQIQHFELAANDRAGKFIPPSKLYGRDREIKTLLESFSRIGSGQKEITLVAGYAGTGKTSLVHEIHKPVTLKNGYFIHGKHEQYQKDVPYFAISQAITSFVELIVAEKEERLSAWKKTILEVIGNEGKLLTDLVPKLEVVIGPQKPLEALGLNEAQNRFTYTFIQFLKAISTEKNPVVLFIDDLQWADVASLTLLKNIVTDPGLRYLYFIGSYRDHEVDSTHPTYLTLEEIARQGIFINEIHTGDLEPADLEKLVSDTLSGETGNHRELVEIVFGKTAGNPFFVNQFLQSMYEDGYIRYETEAGSSKGKWTWDVEEMKRMNFTDNVVEFMLMKIKNLDSDVQEILKFASCIGDGFDLRALQFISSSPLKTVAQSLWKALKEEYILSDGNQHDLTRLLMGDLNRTPENLNLTYTFTHDRIRQASYELIPADERAELHQKIGQLMLSNIQEQDYEEYIFEIVYQLNRGNHENISADMRLVLIKLNGIAGTKAKASSAYQTALSYFEIGNSFVGENHWRDHHSLTFDLHLRAMECAYLIGDYAKMEALGETLLAHCQDVLEATKIKNIRIYSFIAQNRHAELIDFGVEVLKDLGIQLPKNPRNHHIVLELVKTKWALQKKDSNFLANLPAMEDEKIQLGIHIMSSISTASYHNLPKLFPLAIFKAVRLALTYGNSHETISFYGGYGSILCGVTNEFRKGYEFGKLSLKLLDELANTKHVRPKTYVIFGTFIIHWQEHLKASLDYLKKAFLIAMESGDPQYAASAIFVQSYARFWMGENIDQLLPDLKAFGQKMDQLNQASYSLYFKIFVQGIHNLKQKSLPENYLTGEMFNEQEFHKSELAHDKTALFHINFNKLYLNYLFGNYEDAATYADETRAYLEVILSTYYIPLYYFYDSLIQLSLLAKAPRYSRKKLVKRVTSNQKKMSRYKDAAPMNFLHKYLLVEAELYAYAYGKQTQAMQCYNDSIKHATENGYINEVALGCELAGKYYGKINLPDLETKFIVKSYETYSKWGAKFKGRHLTHLFPNILTRSVHPDLTKSHTHTSQFNAGNLLDLSTILKASTAISSEIRLEKVVQKLLEIAVENVGAQSGTFILCEKDQLKLYSFMDINGDVRHDPSGLSGKNSAVAYSIVQFVHRTQQNLIVDDVSSDERFSTDPYVKGNRLASVLCSPVLHHGALLGIIYLENNSIKGAFTEQRLEVLNMLSGQIAITVNNALLYENLESKVRERTEEIHRQKEQLKLQNIELRTINDEKDDLINVVSHDLRSPLNQIKGLAEITSMVSEENEVKEYTSKITDAAERLNNMIVRILDVSAIESQKLELQPEKFDIVPVIGGLLTEFETTAQKKNIKIGLRSGVKSMTVYLDKVHFIQIMENLLSNALKFSEPGKAVSVKLTDKPNEILLEVKDEGPGISAEDQKRLFNKFQKLSAQPTGGEKSVGLGLSIVKKYVETMGGRIWCESELNKGSSFFISFPLEKDGKFTE